MQTGNLLSDGVKAYSYDSAKWLTLVFDNGVITQYAYNGDGNRYVQIANGVQTNYALDLVGLAEVLAASTNGQDTFYVPGLAQYSSEWQYFAPDRLDSVRQLVDSAGQLALTQSFDPFGNVFEQSGLGQSVFGYTGEQVDPTDLVFLRARYYAPNRRQIHYLGSNYP